MPTGTPKEDHYSQSMVADVLSNSLEVEQEKVREKGEGRQTAKKTKRVKPTKVRKSS